MTSDHIARLRTLAQQGADSTVDVPAVIAVLVKEATLQGVEPWVLIGVLLESAAHLIREAIPEQQRAECVGAALLMLRERAGV
jgi:hypothetical protein